MEALRIVLLVFFLTHIPATLLIDAQAGALVSRVVPRCCALTRGPPVIPSRYVPAFASRLLQWHVESTGDPLMNHVAAGRPPFAPWFKALIVGELSLQLPFFFVASYAFAAKRNWIRIPALCYGVHTATTLMPILAELAASTEVPSEAARLQLVGLYLPYLLLPLACAAWMAASPQPFGPAAAPAKAKPRARKAD